MIHASVDGQTPLFIGVILIGLRNKGEGLNLGQGCELDLEGWVWEKIENECGLNTEERYWGYGSLIEVLI